MALKIVVIGGGSSYTPELVEGLIKRRGTLPVTELVFVDIQEGEEKVRLITSLVRRMFDKGGMTTQISYTFNRQEALVGADFVLTQFRVGGLKARGLDERLPLKYGMIGQETTGPGGFAKALRTIPVMAEICRDIEAICPNAWMVNFTNPSGIITEFVNNHTKVKSIGLCNVPINMVYDAAEKLGVNAMDLSCQFVGLNHLSFMTHAYDKGLDRLPEVLAIDQGEGIVKNIEKIDDSDELARRIGLMLSPYMQYFYFETDMLKKELGQMNQGEGTRAEQVEKVEADLFEQYSNMELKEKPEALSLRGGARYSEAAIHLIDSIFNNTGDVQVVNVLNNGAISDLPMNASIETNCLIHSHGATPLSSGPLPLPIRGLVGQVKVYEQYTIKAAMTGDRSLALLALMNNPLVHNVKDAKDLLEDFIDAHQPYLDYFNH